MPSSTRSERTGWYMYDWANSAFSTTVITVLLPKYSTALARAGADADGNIRILGLAIYADSYWSFMMAFSVILQVLVLPVIGTLADTSAHKKRLLAMCAYAGSIPTIGLFFIQSGNWQAVAPLFIVANVAFGASIVVSNSFLNDLSAPEERDAVSSRGWAIGYIGGGLLLLLNLLLVQNAEKLGMSEGYAVRVSLASSGLWWALFTIWPLVTLRDRPPVVQRSGKFLGATFGQFVHTLRDMRRYPQALTFLIAYLLYNDAVQAVISLSSQFATEELGIAIGDLMPVILAVQFVAFAGAMLFGGLARLVGAKATIMLQLVIWTALVIGVYAAVQTLRDFWIASMVVALVLGGTQALSRSLFSLLIPKGREAEYFSLYEISDKGTAWLAPAIFGVTLNFTRNYRSAIVSLIAFFILGLIVLARVRVQPADAAVRSS
ncbi:MAG TPA: MFS transporter [Bryobacteraceae bacterium]|nr:MFS transporter [Bryobacteraceae bacterium]